MLITGYKVAVLHHLRRHFMSKSHSSAKLEILRQKSAFYKIKLRHCENFTAKILDLVSEMSSSVI